MYLFTVGRGGLVYCVYDDTIKMDININAITYIQTIVPLQNYTYLHSIVKFDLFYKTIKINSKQLIQNNAEK